MLITFMDRVFKPTSEDYGYNVVQFKVNITYSVLVWDLMITIICRVQPSRRYRVAD